MCGICISAPARAQVAGGNFSGTISDPSGRLVPQAQISIQNVATGITTTVTTNSDGYYTAVNLLPGEYQITVSAKGFATEVRKGISLTVGAQQVIDLTMQVGSAAKIVVEVTTEAPAVQLASSDISAVGADRGNRGFGQQLTISGARPQQNNYRLDGISLNDYANGAPGSVLGGSLGVDAIQEFSVLTSNYSAEYGKTSGGVINSVTRSGTNSFHGSAYEFLRNSHLDARNFFDAAGEPTPPFKRNQFGGAVGGPIIKNRTFFFVDYEGTRQSKGISTVATVPSENARNGLLAGGNVTVDPSAAAYLTFYPLPQ